MIKILRTERLCGFHMQFANGWLISVQIGQGNYHDNRYKPMSESPNAEIAVWHRNSPMVPWPNLDTAQGYVTPDRIAAIIAHISALPDNPYAFEPSTFFWLGADGSETLAP